MESHPAMRLPVTRWSRVRVESAPDGKSEAAGISETRLCCCSPAPSTDQRMIVVIVNSNRATMAIQKCETSG